jgi:hypothetical protein
MVFKIVYNFRLNAPNLSRYFFEVAILSITNHQNNLKSILEVDFHLNQIVEKRFKFRFCRKSNC